MFYCDDCRNERSWPESFSKSYGSCELCRKVANCNDVSSGALPRNVVPAGTHPSIAYMMGKKDSKGELEGLRVEVERLRSALEDAYSQYDLGYVRLVIGRALGKDE